VLACCTSIKPFTTRTGLGGERVTVVSIPSLWLLTGREGEVGGVELLFTDSQVFLSVVAVGLACVVTVIGAR